MSAEEEYWNEFFNGFKCFDEINKLSNDDFNKFVEEFKRGITYTVNITENDIKKINKELLDEN